MFNATNIPNCMLLYFLNYMFCLSHFKFMVELGSGPLEQTSESISKIFTSLSQWDRESRMPHPVNQIAFVLAIRKPSTDDLQQNHSKSKCIALDVCLFVLWRIQVARERGFVIDAARSLLMFLFGEHHFPALKINQLKTKMENNCVCFTRLESIAL